MATNPPKAKNIYVVGAQCTGKTTLVNALASHYSDAEVRPLPIKEVARGVLRKHNYTAADMTNSPLRALELQHLIFSAQVTAEEELGNNWFISDRSALDPVAYAYFYVGEEAAASMLESEAWQASRARMRDGVVLVCEAGTPWLVDDGVRLMPEDPREWAAIHETFCRVLQEQGIPFTLVPKETMNLAKRVDLFLAKSYESASTSFIERRNPQPNASKRHYAQSSAKRKGDKGGHELNEAEARARNEGKTTIEGAEDEGVYWNEYLMFGVLAIPATVGIWYLLKPLGILDPYLGVSMIKETEPKRGNLRETEGRSKYN
ncbi:hypothetical protein BU16DRAFT_538405 [Lophium mytilinum]|uniref:NadR/Ttd14 AAA domain-containing protein n=1 Tax=Lophium mytilinum TaxID=390894 RepID=A0A6A6QTC9_9PEZI|nr:hypothetical protein BU16DRAFT_538405 [Lophium mytilinum]